MSWNKSIFSYVTWFLYTVLTGLALAGAAGLFCVRAGIAAHWGILFAVILLLAAGNIVFLLGRHRDGLAAFAQRNRKMLRVLEAAAVTLLLIVGVVLRAEGAADVPQSSVYFDRARVAEGQRIPHMAHGAVYYYLGLLRGVFLLVGNHFQAGVWLQILLQLAGFILLYFVIRNLTDSIAAMVVLAFCTCGPYMVRSAGALSPEPLFSLLFLGVFWLVAAGAGGRRNLVLLFLLGVPIAFCCYLDIMGIMLLFFAVAVVFLGRKAEPGRGRKAMAAFFCVSGTALGFFATACLDALVSGRKLGEVLLAWWLLYRPDGFRLPTVAAPAEGGTEGAVIAVLLTLGVFSFWCDRERERMSIWVIAAVGMAAAACTGIFTEEMPGYGSMYLSLAVLAGIGIGQCLGGTKEAAAEYGAAEGAALPGTETQDCPAEEGEGGLRKESSEEAERAGGQAPSEAPQEPRQKEAGGHGGVKMAEQKEVSPQENKAGEKQVRYIENPLPLPKKHEKRVLDFPVRTAGEQDDFDYPVCDEDDFDI